MVVYIVPNKRTKSLKCQQQIIKGLSLFYVVCVKTGPVEFSHLNMTKKYIIWCGLFHMYKTQKVNLYGL